MDLWTCEHGAMVYALWIHEESWWYILTWILLNNCEQSTLQHFVVGDFSSFFFSRNATALLRLPESENRQGCSPHPNLHFQNSIALIQRGVERCVFCWISKFSSINLCPQLHKLANMKGVAAGRDIPFFWEFQISLQEVAIFRGRWCLLKRLELWLSSFMTPWSVSPLQSLLLLGHFQIQGLIWNPWHSWGSEHPVTFV